MLIPIKIEANRPATEEITIMTIVGGLFYGRIVERVGSRWTLVLILGIMGASCLTVGLSHGVAMAVLVTAIGHISGGHLNPAVSVGFWVTKRMGTLDTLFYCVAQLLGSIAAAFTLAAILPESVWRPVALGAPDLAQDFTRMHGMLLEAVMTFFLLAAPAGERPPPDPTDPSSTFR